MTEIAGFVICATLIVLAGSRLSFYGDLIAEHTGMGKAWLGLILMAAVTSLPELITGMSALVLLNSPDIAVGDIMGSCVFNLVILSVLDFLVPGKPLSSVVTKGHLMAGLLGSFLLTLSVISILFHDVFPVIGWFSSASLLMVLLYLVSVRIIFSNERRLSEQQTPPAARENLIPLSVAVKRYILFALIVVASAISLPFFADKLAELWGVNKSFVGTLLVAAATSLPELVVSIAAVRIGSMDMAVGNLLGSNIFNMMILALDDFVYTFGPLPLVVSDSHGLSALVAILMTAVAGIGILYGKPNKRFALGADTAVLVILYLLLMILLFRM